MFASAKNNTQEATTDMENEGGRTLRDAKDGVRHIKSDVRDAAAHLKNDAEELARQTGRHARELADAATSGASDLSKNVTSYIRENSVQSSFIALGVGLFIGMLSRRR